MCFGQSSIREPCPRAKARGTCIEGRCTQRADYCGRTMTPMPISPISVKGRIVAICGFQSEKYPAVKFPGLAGAPLWVLVESLVFFNLSSMLATSQVRIAELCLDRSLDSGYSVGGPTDSREKSKGWEKWMVSGCC